MGIGNSAPDGEISHHRGRFKMGTLQNCPARAPGKSSFQKMRTRAGGFYADLLFNPSFGRKNGREKREVIVGGILGIFCNNAVGFAVREYVILRIPNGEGGVGLCGVVSLVNTRCITIL